MAQCPNCGAQLSLDAEQCSQCAALLTSGDRGESVPDGSVRPTNTEAAKPAAPQDREQRDALPRQPRVPDAPALQFARVLTHAALGSWVASLLLPGFVVLAQSYAWNGGLILFMGLLFGWAVHGWAAYANLLFPYIVIRLYRRKAAPLAVWVMILLAATIVFFKGVIEDEGSMAAVPVVSWGLGAVLWFGALILSAIASMIHAGTFRRRAAIAGVGTLGVISVALGVVHLVQRSLANEQEREIYLSKGMVFTTARFCGVPFAWPEKSLIPRDEMVTLDVEDELRSPRSGSPHLLLPRFGNFQEQGVHWRIYRDPTSSRDLVKVRALAQPGRFVLQARRTDQGAVIRLIDKETRETLYEQQLRATARGHYPTYCPYATQQWRKLTKGYDRAVLRAVGQEPAEKAQVRDLAPQIAREPCSLRGSGVDVPGLRAWDGRFVILASESLSSSVGFCSDAYIALVRVWEHSADPADLGTVVDLFDRRTMEPIATFNDGRGCPKRWCDEAPKTILKGVRIEKASVIVETQRGDLRASHTLH